jgi:peptidoglycan/LPS O-acetylase OafA/YrhL
MPTTNSIEFQLVRKHMPELDVLRGVAILSVILYHGFYWTNRGVYQHAWQTRFMEATVFGWLGVNLFFILSGFLITGILLDTKTKPYYYKNFYIKRALRILPALATTLILLVAFRQTSFSALCLSMFFLVNYAANLGVANVYGPLWSLGVEEHFYLLWPTVVHRLKTSTITWIAVALCVIEPVLRYYSSQYHLGDPHSNTHMIADYLAVGALVAIFAQSQYATTANSIRLGVGLILIGFLMLLAGLPYGILHRTNGIGDALQVVPFNGIFSGTLVFMLALQLRFFSSVWVWPLRYLGEISYGLYLYHILAFSAVSWMLKRYGVLQGTGDFRLVVERFLLMFALALLVSHISRRWMEQYFLNMKKYLAH